MENKKMTEEEEEALRLLGQRAFLTHVDHIRGTQNSIAYKTLDEYKVLEQTLIKLKRIKAKAKAYKSLKYNSNNKFTYLEEKSRLLNILFEEILDEVK